MIYEFFAECSSTSQVVYIHKLCENTQMFSVYAVIILDSHLRHPRAKISYYYLHVIVFEKHPFCSHQSTKPVFSNSSGLKSALKSTVFAAD